MWLGTLRPVSWSLLVLLPHRLCSVAASYQLPASLGKSAHSFSLESSSGRWFCPRCCYQCFRFEVLNGVLSAGLLVGLKSRVSLQRDRPELELLADDEQPFLLLWLSTLLLFWGQYCSLWILFSFAIYFGMASLPKGRLYHGQGLVHDLCPSLCGDMSPPEGKKCESLKTQSSIQNCF